MRDKDQMQNDKDKEIHDAHFISPEDYLRNKMANENQPQTDDKEDGKEGYNGKYQHNPATKTHKLRTQ